MTKSLYPKIALVTGSSKGIGKAIAIRLAKDGYFVYVTYFTDKDGGIDTVKKIKDNGGEGLLVNLNVADEKSVENLMNNIQTDFGHLDVLVNNSARSIDKSIEDSTLDEWKFAFDNKLHGTWLCTKYAIPLLQKSKNANVVVISSSADERPSQEILSYAVATGAVNSLIKSLAPYLTKYGIRTNAIMPGEVRTANWGEAQFDDKLWEDIAKNNPLGRVTTVEDVADAVMIPIDDPHKFLNGNFIFVNGGSHLK